MDTPIPNCFYRVSIKALVLDESRRFLLVREDNGLWELPGGGMDFGERPHECLKREIWEEMALELHWMGDSPSYFFPAINPKGQHIVNVVYPAQLLGLEFVPSPECREIRFFSSNEVLEMAPKMYPNVVEFAKLYGA